jgi:ATP-binding protein involved in chromosome partitioning
MPLTIPQTRPDRGPLLSGVKNVVAVASAKGGVGKSTVASNLAVALALQGAKTGLVDLDVYGPSIPLMFDVWEQPKSEGQAIRPLEKYGVKLMSIGFLSERGASISWRGPLVTKLVNQFVRDVLWGDLDYLIIDLPPGTGDVQLTLSQTVPLSGGLIVTTPQQVAVEDVQRGITMFEKVSIPVLGLVENMSYFLCPGCSQKHQLFGSGGGKAEAQRRELALLAEIPLIPDIVTAGDKGKPSALDPSSPAGAAYKELALALDKALADLAG